MTRARIGRQDCHQPWMKRLRDAAITCICVLGLAGPSYASDVEIHGFISQGYLRSTGNNFLGQTMEGEWEFNEVGINFGTELDDNLRVGVQLFARDLGHLGNGSMDIDWAFGDYTYLDELNFRVGRIKQPFGLHGEYQDLDLTRATVILPQSVYFAALRDLFVSFNGGQIYGNLDFEEAGLGNFDYQLCMGAIFGPVNRSDSSMADFLNNRAYDLFNDKYAARVTYLKSPSYYGGALQWNTPWETIFEDMREGDGLGSLVLKFTMTYSPSAIAKLDLEPDFVEQLQALGQAGANYPDEVRYDVTNLFFWVASMQYTLDEFQVDAEYARYWGILESSLAPIVPHSTVSQERFYVQASYRFSDFLQAATYYAVQLDPEDRSGESDAYGEYSEQKPPKFDSWQKDLTVALRFDITDNWLFKIEGHLIDGTTQVYSRLNTETGFRNRYWTLFGAKTTLQF